jgi:hypothetical protein
MAVAEPLPYRSPIRKLVRFFERSRDQWKEKCQKAKRENNSLKVRLAAMKESRDRWKTTAMELKEEEWTTADTVPEVAATKKHG